MKPLVFLHGWAQSQQIWFQQRQQFPDALYLNLPGHGGAEDADDEQWVDSIVAALPDQACLLVGWSLGGMLAIQIAARYPQHIAALALVSTTPRFKASENWPHGCSQTDFDALREAVASGSAKALNRFFALMLHGDDISRRDYNTLAKAAVDKNNSVSQSGLEAGLGLLDHLDLRQLLPEIKQPTLFMHGQNDAITPVQAGIWLADQCAAQIQQTHWFDLCGHAPFLTQATQFNQTLQTWWQQQ